MFDSSGGSTVFFCGGALEYLNKLEQDAGGDANLEHELAMAYTKIADVQGQIMEASLLETGKAAENYGKALNLADKTTWRETVAEILRGDEWIIDGFTATL